MITIAIANQKGGVGKTTIAFNLAQILSSRRRTRILTIDNDSQGNLTSSFIEDPTSLKANILNAYDGKSIEPEPISKNLYFIGANINLAPVAERDFQVIYRLKEFLETLKNKNRDKTFQYVVIDCLPSFGHLSLAALTAADYVLIPVKPAPYSLTGMSDLFTTVEKAKKYFNPGLRILGIVINQLDGRKPIMEREMEAALRKTYGDLVLKTKINKRVKVEESPAFQQGIADYDPDGPSAQQFEALAMEILRRIRRLEARRELK